MEYKGYTISTIKFKTYISRIYKCDEEIEVFSDKDLTKCERKAKDYINRLIGSSDSITSVINDVKKQ